MQTFNLCEAALWLACAVAVGVASRRSAAGARRNAWLAVVAFLAFGVSDLIEIQTGGWWRPWWLFALKAACVATLVAAFYRHHRRSNPR